MTLSDVSIKNPVFAWMLMIGLIVFGWVGFNRMGVSQLPDVDFPIVTVTVTLEGAAPEIMETQVTDPIEDAVMSVQGIREVSSTSRQGLSTISIEFELSRDIDVALQEVQTKIAQAVFDLSDVINSEASPNSISASFRDDDLLELLNAGSFPHDAHVQLLLLIFDPAGRNFRMLGLDRIEHVAHGQFPLLHFVRVQPDSQTRFNVTS